MKVSFAQRLNNRDVKIVSVQELDIIPRVGDIVDLPGLNYRGVLIVRWRLTLGKGDVIVLVDGRADEHHPGRVEQWL